MKLFLAGFIFGLLGSLINRRLFKKAFEKSRQVEPLKGYLIFSRINFLRIVLDIFVFGAALLKGIPAALGAIAGLLLQRLLYIYDIYKLSRKG